MNWNNRDSTTPNNHSGILSVNLWSSCCMFGMTRFNQMSQHFAHNTSSTTDASNTTSCSTSILSLVPIKPVHLSTTVLMHTSIVVATKITMAQLIQTNSTNSPTRGKKPGLHSVGLLERWVMPEMPVSLQMATSQAQCIKWKCIRKVTSL